MKSVKSLYPVIEPAFELCLDMGLLEVPFILNKEETRSGESTLMIFDYQENPCQVCRGGQMVTGTFVV